MLHANHYLYEESSGDVQYPFGYKYHINLVVADLGVVNVILEMDFSMAYGAIIDLKADQVSLQSGTIISILQGFKE